MTSWVCLDSGIVLKLVLKEPDSQRARELWQTCMTINRQPVAPLLFAFEITSVLRKNVHRGTITSEYGFAALKRLLRLDIRLLTTKDIHLRAWQLATQLNRPATHDAHYLALAEHLGCEFWTADRRLYNTVHPQLPWVHHLDHFQP